VLALLAVDAMGARVAVGPTPPETLTAETEMSVLVEFGAIRAFALLPAKVILAAPAVGLIISLGLLLATVSPVTEALGETPDPGLLLVTVILATVEKASMDANVVALEAATVTLAPVGVAVTARLEFDAPTAIVAPPATGFTEPIAEFPATVTLASPAAVVILSELLLLAVVIDET
jgi:hypothetical protein